MTPDEREQMFALCAKIADERDPHKFTQLITQLNELLERKERRLDATLK
jgi:hypothetical protein